MRSFSSLALAVALAGQALAVTIPLGGSLGNLSAPALLSFGSNSDFVSQAQCTTQCNNATSLLTNCGTNDQCTCTNNIGTAMLSCEQCLFTYIIDQNIPAPNPLLGSQPALDGFVAACLAPPLNITVAPLKLALPPSWDGPQSNKLGLGVDIVTVIAGALLGSGSLYLLTHLE